MAKVPVIYVPNENVGRLIKCIGSKSKGATTRLRKKADELATNFAVSSPAASKKGVKNVLSCGEATGGATTSVGQMMNDESSPFCDVYSFKTPKRAKQMFKYATASAQKARMQNVRTEQESQTPTSKLRESKNQSTLSLKDTEDRLLRHRCNGLRSLPLITDTESDTEDDISSDGLDSDGDDLEDRDPAQGKEEKSCRVGLRRQHFPSETELYFDAHSQRKSGRTTLTSDRTLQKLRNPRMEVTKLNEVLKQHGKSSRSVDRMRSISDCQHLLLQRHRLNFTKWMFYLCNNFNILMFGLGSKRKLLKSFCDAMLAKFTKLVICGFFPGLTIKSILSSITDDILKLPSGSTDTETQLERIREHYAKKTAEPLFLVVHNIDGAPLRSSQAQMVLSSLSEMPSIHLIASIDHINASLIWDQTRMSRFRWLWYDVTTYSPYVSETSFEGSLMLTTVVGGVSSRCGALALRGLRKVTDNLTSNAKAIFRIVAERQVVEKGDKEEDVSEEVFTFFDLYRKCRENFLVSSEPTLRAHLKEFVDHKYMRVKTGIDGYEYISIPLDDETLKEYLEEDQTS